MVDENYISYVKELILHHCLRCSILSERTTCEICRREINGEPVMVKVEVKITGSAVDADVVGMQGDFRELTSVALRWKPSEFHLGNLYAKKQEGEPHAENFNRYNVFEEKGR